MLHLGRGRHHQRGDTVLVDVARGREYGLSLPARHGLGLLRVAMAGVLHLVDVGRAGAAGERRAGRAVRRAEGDLGEALAVLLVEPDQPVQLVLDVVDLGEREREGDLTRYCRPPRNKLIERTWIDATLSRRSSVCDDFINPDI